MEGYYKPEWSSCQCCDPDEVTDPEAGPTRVTRLYWWWYLYNRRQADKALDRWVDEQVALMENPMVGIECNFGKVQPLNYASPNGFKPFDTTASETILPTWAELEARSKANWARISEDNRRCCLIVLKTALPKDFVDELRAQVASGKAICKMNPRFHFSEGMQIRNILRKVLPDQQLPGWTEFRNWDDFYIGALHALVADTTKPG